MICPYCGEKQTDLFEVTGAYEDGEHEVTCQHCGKDFELITRVEHTYSTYVKEDDGE
jgi:transcriptional regulator NrdR family protein